MTRAAVRLQEVHADNNVFSWCRHKQHVGITLICPSTVITRHNFTMVVGYLTPPSTELENMVLPVCPPPPQALHMATLLPSVSFDDCDDAPLSADLSALISRVHMGKLSCVGQLKRRHGHDGGIRPIPIIQLKPRPFSFTPPMIHPLVDVQVNDQGDATLDETTFSAPNDTNKPMSRSPSYAELLMSRSKKSKLTRSPSFISLAA